MPKHTISVESKQPTRNEFTTVDLFMTVTIDGKELPTLGLMGEAFEAAQEILRAKIKESYQIVPARV